ncbi:MAG: transketolase [Eggerthellaceae bacterium]|jgi:transketolase
MDSAELSVIANGMRKDIIRMISKAGSGHPGGSLSCIDILTALYFGDVMSYDAQHPDWEERDYLILSKGHAAPALYAVLARAGYFPADELDSLRKLGSRLQGHPDSSLVPGVEVGTGSLGQGMSVACGLACGLRINRNEHTVFSIIGDGEAQEGQIWEAATFAAHEQLDNLVVILDANGLQIDGPTADVCQVGDLGDKFTVFGWDVERIDGHDFSVIVPTLKRLQSTRNGKPHLVVASTVKGKGVSFMENAVGWHGKAPNPEQTEEALAELSKEDR